MRSLIYDVKHAVSREVCLTAKQTVTLIQKYSQTLASSAQPFITPTLSPKNHQKSPKTYYITNPITLAIDLLNNRIN